LFGQAKTRSLGLVTEKKNKDEHERKKWVLLDLVVAILATASKTEEEDEGKNRLLVINRMFIVQPQS